MSLRHTRRLVILLALLALLTACGSSDGSSPDPAPEATGDPPSVTGTVATPEVVETVTAPEIERETLTITAADGTRVDLFAELAVTPEERAQGLMGRRELDPDSGMLFVIEPPGRGFWMKDTPIALTIAFIATCGEIVDLVDMEPLSEEVKNASQPYAFALEMEQGWFSQNGIAVGDVVQLPPDLLPAEC